MDAPTVRQRPLLCLAVASFSLLFFEMALIRWTPSAVHVIGFFTTIVLIGSFMGAGLGMWRGGHSDDDADAAVHAAAWRMLATLVLFAPWLIIHVKATIPSGEHSLNETSDAFTQLHIPLLVLLPAVYAWIVYTFIPLGQLVGVWISSGARIRAYSVNILGSLAGVVDFTLMSGLYTPPAAWFALGFASLVVLSRRRLLHTGLGLVAVVLLLGTYTLEERQMQWKNFWSPYYNLKVYALNGDSPSTHGFGAMVGNFFLLTGTSVTASPATKEYQLYSLPFQYIKPRRVLVLGSGGGNDVAMALLQGAERVDAVEIDPTVLWLGRNLNPTQPYADPRVHVYNTDARKFLRSASAARGEGPYDLVIYGTLDSHGLFSALSSIKMENFVYTRDSLEDARRLLSPQGVVSVTIGYEDPFVYQRMCVLLEQVFGAPPVTHVGLWTVVTMVNGPGVAGQRHETAPIKIMPTQRIHDAVASHPSIAITPDDDWPHLFLQERRLPGVYWAIGGLIMLVSLAWVRLGAPEGFGFSPHFFFLGTGFLLLETRSITALALTFGSTWVTSSVVIGSILLVILVANTVVERLPPAPEGQGVTVPYALLLASLLVIWLVPAKSLLMDQLWLQVLVVLAFVGCPVFFAAIIFGRSFAAAPDANGALASNLMGSVLGGLSEYVSMVYGFRSLALVAMAMYLLSWAALRRR